MKRKKLYWQLHRLIMGSNFSGEEYLNLYPDVANSQLDPWEHYIKYGRYEGRKKTLKLTRQEKQHIQQQNEVSFLYDRHIEDFVDIAPDSYQRHENDARLLAFYLPQFHCIPLNDKHFGRGFTEWTNVTKAKPLYKGHHQPQLPIDVGFYDLSHDGVMYRQIELAKQYGIYGFCFYYYWFGKNKRLLERPIFNWLKNKELDFPFCLCWANENWSTRWDGGNQNVIMKQDIQADSYVGFFEDIRPFFEDSRYVRIDGKPVLVIYRPTMFTQLEFTSFVDRLRDEAQKHGFPGLHILITDAFDGRKLTDCAEWHVEGMVEFPPHTLRPVISSQKIDFLHPNRMQYNNMGTFLRNKEYLNLPHPKNGSYYRGVFTSWDNSARKTYVGGHIFDGCTPDLYEQWLTDSILAARHELGKGNEIVFINAWNEWAEGTHLEPDSRYGYAYLQATRNAMENARTTLID